MEFILGGDNLAGGLFGGGIGTELDPYLVEDANDLNAVRNNLAACYKQVANIDLSIYPNWSPLGDIDVGPPFTGEFNGQRYLIDNLTISSNNQYLGLFGLTAGATIKKVVLNNANITGTSDHQITGILAAIVAYSVVEDSITIGSINAGDGPAGGFVCTVSNDSTVSRCSSNVTVEGSNVAAFAAYVYGAVSDCYALGTVKGYTLEDFVGLGGMFYDIYSGSVIERCYAATTFENYYEFATLGGFAAHLYGGTVSGCYYDSELSGQPDNGIGAPKTTAQMKQASTFVNWDFDEAWAIIQGSTYPFFSKDLVLTAPTLLTNKIKSANPLIKMLFPKIAGFIGGPLLHFRVEAFADEAMTTLLDDRTSDVVDSDHPAFEYSFNDATWFDVAPTGINPTQYGNFDMYVRARVHVGPRQQVYIRCGVGIDDAE